MKLLMHILKENKSLGVDNTTLDFNKILLKMEEEYREVIEAAKRYDSNKSLRNLKELVRETFDLIQIWRCHRKALDLDEPKLMEEINIEHKDKLISERHWIPETGIEIDIKE